MQYPEPLASQIRAYDQRILAVIAALGYGGAAYLIRRLHTSRQTYYNFLGDVQAGRLPYWPHLSVILDACHDTRADMSLEQRCREKRWWDEEHVALCEQVKLVVAQETTRTQRAVTRNQFVPRGGQTVGPSTDTLPSGPGVRKLVAEFS